MAYNLTIHGKKELENELADLRTAYEAIVARVAEARSQGDLRENAEYENAREEQSKTQNRIEEIEEILKTAKIIRESRSNRVQLGSHVALSNGEQYEVVGSLEASPLDGRISNESPLGKTLLGKQVGDVVAVETPKGAKEYKIDKIF
jgi:transcription elongation factor GreA